MKAKLLPSPRGAPQHVFLKIHRHKHKGRMEEDRSSPTDGDKHKNPERGGGRLMESNTEINTNEWLLSRPEKGNFSPMREGERERERETPQNKL